jgi:hypothetical protein
MRLPTAIVLGLACLAALAAAGCGSQGDDSTPVACLEGEAAYLNALRAAPGEVTLAGETPISGCLAENQQAGDLASVGEALVKTATKLNAEARAEPGGEANLRLGYLLGAAQRGADKSEGIHTDLIRRLTVAARFAPDPEPLSKAFLATYAKGFEAGHTSG